MSDYLKLFVYGSLKTGECNEAELAPWLERLVPAQTRGTMRLRPDGYPALELSEYGDIGTLNYGLDLRLDRAPQPSTGNLVPGQLMWLRRGVEALPRLDDFEGFWPGHPCEYLRVAICVETKTGLQACWTYVGAGPSRPEWPIIEHWPPKWFEGPPEPYEPFSI